MQSPAQSQLRPAIIMHQSLLSPDTLFASSSSSSLSSQQLAEISTFHYMMNSHQPKVFLSHSTLDRDEIVRPLAFLLHMLQVPVFYDEYDLIHLPRSSSSPNSIESNPLLYLSSAVQGCGHAVILMSRSYFDQSLFNLPTQQLSAFLDRSSSSSSSQSSSSTSKLPVNVIPIYVDTNKPQQLEQGGSSSLLLMRLQQQEKKENILDVSDHIVSKQQQQQQHHEIKQPRWDVILNFVLSHILKCIQVNDLETTNKKAAVFTNYYPSKYPLTIPSLNPIREVFMLTSLI